MRDNNSMNTSSLACKRKARNASKVRKHGQIFGRKMFSLPLYLRNAAPSTPIKCGSNAQEKAKEKGGKEKGG